MMKKMNKFGMSAALLMVLSGGVRGGDGLACMGVGVELFTGVPQIYENMEFQKLSQDAGELFFEYFSDEHDGFIVLGPGGFPDGRAVKVEGFLAAVRGGDYAYAANDQSQLISYDISDRYDIVELSILHVGGVLEEIVADDGVLVGQRDAMSLQLVDVSDPSSPVAAGELGVVGQVRAFHLDSGLLSVATGDDEILFFDVTDPHDPAQIAAVQGIGVVTDHVLESANGWLFSGDDEALTIVDISVPSAPVVSAVIGYEELLDGFNIDPRSLRGMDCSEGMLGMAFGSGGGFAFDLSNPKNPQLIAQYDTSSLEAGVAIDQGQLVLLSSEGLVYKSDIDALNAANPLIPMVEDSGFAAASNDIDIVGNTLYASGYSYCVYDISDLSKAVRTEHYQYQSEIVYSAAQYQGYSYLAAGSVGLVVIDHSRPEGDREILRYNPLQSVVGVHRDGRDLLVVDESGTMIMMDLTFPQAPQIISVAMIPYALERGTIIFEDRMVYAISNEVDHAEAYGLMLDWQQPFQPLLSVEHLEHKYSAMAKGDEYLYAVGYVPQDVYVAGHDVETGIGVLGLSSMREDYFVEFEREQLSVEVLPDQRVLVGDDAGQLMMLDQYPTEETLGVVQLGTALSSEVTSIATGGDLAFVGLQTAGLRVVDISDRCAACPADLDGDGSVDFFDVAAFIHTFSAMSADADLNGDGRWDYFDIAEFLDMVQNDCEGPYL